MCQPQLHFDCLDSGAEQDLVGVCSRKLHAEFGDFIPSCRGPCPGGFSVVRPCAVLAEQPINLRACSDADRCQSFRAAGVFTPKSIKLPAQLDEDVCAAGQPFLRPRIDTFQPSDVRLQFGVAQVRFIELTAQVRHRLFGLREIEPVPVVRYAELVQFGEEL